MLYLDTGYRLTETRPTIGCGSREARWEGRRAGRGSSFLFQGFIYLGLVWGKTLLDKLRLKRLERSIVEHCIFELYCYSQRIRLELI